MKIRPSRHVRWRQLTAALLLSLISFNAAPAQTAAPAKTLSAAEAELASKVSVETIKEVTAALSSDQMQGRGTMQAGGDRAADYIADRFQKLGLKPLGNNNSYFQKINFKESVFTPETSFKLGDEALEMGRDYAVTPPYSGNKSAGGDMVFIAYGIVADAIKRNDLQGLDVRGKIVVMLEGPPANIPETVWKKSKAWISILKMLLAQGVTGIVTVSHGREKQPFAETADYYSRRRVDLADEEEWPAFLPPFVAVSDKTAERMFANSGTTFKDALAQAERNDFKPIKLKQSAKITVKWKKTTGAGSNVVGLLEGSDPALKSEAVLFSAHYDAYGTGTSGKIYHGAADNALGVAEMIAVAEAIPKMPAKPRRSMIFLAVTGEEYGLYGSKYWAKNPTWKIKGVAADLNLDGVGTEVYGPVKTLVGYGAEHSTLGFVLEDIAAAMNIKVIPDPMPDEKVFYRSDHYSFVRRGVPSLMLLGAPEGPTQSWIDRMKAWEKTDYHQPTDTIKPDWNWDGPRTVAVVSALMSWRVAAADKMSAWLPSSRFAKLERGSDKDVPEEP